MRNLSFRLVFPCRQCIIPPWLLQKCLSLVFRSLIVLCLSVNFFRFILFGVCSASRICSFVFVNLGTFLAVIFLHTPLTPLLFTSWDSTDECWLFVIVPPALRLCQSIFSLFTLFAFYWSVFKFTESVLSSPF